MNTFAIINLIKRTEDCMRLELYKQTTSLYIPQSIKLLQRLFPDLSLISYYFYMPCLIKLIFAYLILVNFQLMITGNI